MYLNLKILHQSDGLGSGRLFGMRGRFTNSYLQKLYFHIMTFEPT